MPSGNADGLYANLRPVDAREGPSPIFYASSVIPSMKDSLKLFLVTGLCSFSSLAYEILLTRIFSISLWYHFAFMIVSIAMLGLAASGTALSLFPKLRNPSQLGVYAFSVGISISLSYLLANRIPFDPVALSWSRVPLLTMGLTYVILAVPFFMTGLVVATALSSMAEKSGLIYSGDLLGAGLGSLGVLFLLTLFGPDQVVFVISGVALSAAVVAGGRVLKVVSSVFIVVSLAMLIFRPGLADLRISPYKGLQTALRYPGAEHLDTYDSPFSRIDIFRSPAVRFAPGLSLRYTDPLPEQVGVTIDGGDVTAVTSVRDRNAMAFLRYLPSALPYEIGRREDVLVLNPKGGLQVLMADHYGADHVFKIESIPFLIEVIQRELGTFSGGIYDRNTWSKLPRSWLRSESRHFDLIDMSLTGVLPTGSFGIAEDYGVTVEAFKEYLLHLKPEGLLSIHLFIFAPARIELRLIHTVLTAMEELGMREGERQMAAIRSWGSLCLLAKTSPFKPDEIEAIKSFSEDRRFDLVHYPGIKPEETNVFVRMVSTEYLDALRQLFNPATRNLFIKNYLFNVQAVRDENPFFHYYLKIENIGNVYRRMGEKWQFFIEEGTLLPAIFLQAMVLSLGLILLPVLVRRRKAKETFHKDHPPMGRRLQPFFFFACLGIGFMFVEISWIQKMILVLEHPSYAIPTVLTSLLLSSGIGSFLSYRMARLRTSFVVLVLSVFVLGYSLFLPSFSEIIAPFSLPTKMAAVFGILVPLGILMGIPFPTGLRVLGANHPALIPWAWAINGCFSVLAPLLAILLAMAVGFKVVLWAGALAYFIAFVTFFSPPLQPEGQRSHPPFPEHGVPLFLW